MIHTYLIQGVRGPTYPVFGWTFEHVRERLTDVFIESGREDILVRAELVS